MMPKETLLERMITQFEKDGFRYFKCEKCGMFVHIDYLKEHRCSVTKVKNDET